MKKHIICLGDSNTYGYCAQPSDCADSTLQRYNEEERWTCKLQAALGEGYLVVEEGLPGRTTVFPDPLTEGLCGLDYLLPCLKSHQPVDLLVILLGTNDTKERFGASASCIALGMERLVRKAMSVDCWHAEGGHNILVVAPPVIDKRMEASPVGGSMGTGCAEKSKALPPLLREMAARLGVHFVDAGACQFNTLDYMHLTKTGHSQLAALLAERIPQLR